MQLKGRALCDERQQLYAIAERSLGTRPLSRGEKKVMRSMTSDSDCLQSPSEAWEQGRFRASKAA